MAFEIIKLTYLLIRPNYDFIAPSVRELFEKKSTHVRKIIDFMKEAHLYHSIYGRVLFTFSNAVFNCTYFNTGYTVYFGSSLSSFRRILFVDFCIGCSCPAQWRRT